MENFLTIEALVIVLVLVATLVAIAVRRIRLPYTVSLVLVGYPQDLAPVEKTRLPLSRIVKHERWA